MSKFEQLINELCPDGVEFVSLWEVTIWDKSFNSVDKKKQPKIITYPYLLAADLFKLQQPRGDVFLLSTGEQTGWTNEELASDYLCTGEVVTIPWGKSRPVKEVIKYYKGKFVTADNRIATSSDTKKLSNKYLYHWMLNSGEMLDRFYRGSGIKHPNMNDVLHMQIPLPPLPVQEKIVSFLDDFTELTEKLTAELTAELAARKQQYEYYRDNLLAFGSDVEWKTLDEISTEMYRGSGITRDQVTEKGIPCVRYGEIYTTYDIWFENCVSHTDEDKIVNRKYFENGDILFAITGESVEEIAKSCVYMGNEKCLAGGDIVVLKHNENPKYLAYALSTASAQIQKSKGKVKSKVVHSSIPALRAITIPVPSIPEQQRIADILDCYDKNLNNIVAELLAEIKTRQQQYEYYRAKLLTFKEKEVCVNE